MTGPRSRQYTHRNSIEDMIAIILGIENRRRCIFRHAWEEVGWDAVFDEAHAMETEIDRLLRIVQADWCEIQTFIEEARDAEH